MGNKFFLKSCLEIWKFLEMKLGLETFEWGDQPKAHFVFRLKGVGFLQEKLPNIGNNIVFQGNKCLLNKHI